MTHLLKMLKGAYYWLRVAAGSVLFLFRRETPAFAYYGMVGLFCLTGGRSNDFMSRLIGRLRPNYRLADRKGILGDLSDSARRTSLLGALRERGYCVLPGLLPPEVCDRLLQFGLTTPAKTRIMDNGAQKPARVPRYERESPGAVRYDFEPGDLLANRDVQNLLADASLISLAQDYLGARPVMDVLSMWWHTGYADAPDSHAAQFFHFDMDRPKWLKCFFYLTDVTPESGPHVYVAGSQRTGGIPSSFLERGYVRLSDEEVLAHYGADDIIKFVAPRGTVIIEDTRGLHKGAHVRAGDRLMLQIQFSNSLFGGSYPSARFTDITDETLKTRIAQFPDIYSAYMDGH
jgi:hypothetical protein